MRCGNIFDGSTNIKSHIFDNEDGPYEKRLSKELEGRRWSGWTTETNRLRKDTELKSNPIHKEDTEGYLGTQES